MKHKVRLTVIDKKLYIEPGESATDALIRETAEEADLTVIPDSIREYGYVHRIQKSTVEDDVCFVQDNYYYLCDSEDGVKPQKLDDYELDVHFTMEFTIPKTTIFSNRTKDHGPKDPIMLEREARVLEILLSDLRPCERASGKWMYRCPGIARESLSHSF